MNLLNQSIGANPMQDLNEFLDKYIIQHKDDQDTYVIETSEEALDDNEEMPEMERY
jgi:hypothetical protein